MEENADNSLGLATANATSFRDILDQIPTNLAQLMTRAFIWIDTSMKSQLISKGWPEITRAQVMVFVTCVEGYTRPSEIAQQMGVSRQAVHQTLGELINLGLIELKPDPKDGRAKVVHATEKGRELAQHSWEAMCKAEEELARRIGEENIRNLRAALEQDWGEPLK